MGTKKEQPKVIPLPAVRNTYDAKSAHGENYVGRQIRAARKARGLTIPALAEKLSEYKVSVTRHGVTKWETGGAVPNAYQLMALCCALELRDGFPFFSGMEQPPELNEAGLKKVEEYRMDLIASGRYRPITPVTAEESVIPMRKMRIMRDSPASAGTGSWLEEQNFEIMSFPAAVVPAKADFGIRISGDSMEPAYHDGQYVWVEQCEELNPGEVGIFIYDGESYIKSYSEREPEEAQRELYLDSEGVLHKQPVLVSYNKKYEPKPVSPNLSFAVIGRVLN